MQCICVCLLIPVRCEPSILMRNVRWFNQTCLMIKLKLSNIIAKSSNIWMNHQTCLIELSKEKHKKDKIAVKDSMSKPIRQKHTSR